MPRACGCTARDAGSSSASCHLRFCVPSGSRRVFAFSAALSYARGDSLSVVARRLNELGLLWWTGASFEGVATARGVSAFGGGGPERLRVQSRFLWRPGASFRKSFASEGGAPSLTGAQRLKLAPGAEKSRPLAVFNNGGLNTFYAKIENLKLYLRTTRKAFSRKSNENDFDTGWST